MGAVPSTEDVYTGDMPPEFAKEVVSLDTPLAVAKAFRYSPSGKAINKILKVYKLEFAAALGLMGLSLPYSGAAIAVWGVLKQMAKFKFERRELARKIASLDAAMSLLRAQFSMMKVYWAPEARVARGLRADCATGCNIPIPTALSFWVRMMKKLSNGKTMAKLSPTSFRKKLTIANDLVVMELAQLQSVFTVQQLLDQGVAEDELDAAGTDALRRWRRAVQLSVHRSAAPAAAAAPAAHVPEHTALLASLARDRARREGRV